MFLKHVFDSFPDAFQRPVAPVVLIHDDHILPLPSSPNLHPPVVCQRSGKLSSRCRHVSGHLNMLCKKYPHDLNISSNLEWIWNYLHGYCQYFFQLSKHPLIFKVCKLIHRLHVIALLWWCRVQTHSDWALSVQLNCFCHKKSQLVASAVDSVCLYIDFSGVISILAMLGNDWQL